MRRSAISNTLIGETIVKKEVKTEEEEEELVVSDRHYILNGSSNRGIKRGGSPTQSDEIDTSKYMEMVSIKKAS